MSIGLIFVELTAGVFEIFFHVIRLTTGLFPRSSPGHAGSQKEQWVSWSSPSSIELTKLPHHGGPPKINLSWAMAERLSRCARCSTTSW